MTTDNNLPAPIPVLTDRMIVNALVGASGDHKLAATRLGVTEDFILERLPLLDLSTLRDGIQVARTLQMFRLFTDVKNVVMNDLDELTPDRRAKLLIELSDRFETVLNPPVHGGSGQSANVQVNFGNVEDARAKLASRIIPVVASAPADRDPSGDDAGRDLQPPVRLGSVGASRTTGADDTVVDMALADGSRFRENLNGRTDDSEES